jgi:hypothetical protein
MKQVARNLTDVTDGFLVGKQYLLMDRDASFSAEFRDVLCSGRELSRCGYRRRRRTAIHTSSDSCYRSRGMLGPNGSIRAGIAASGDARVPRTLSSGAKSSAPEREDHRRWTGSVAWSAGSAPRNDSAECSATIIERPRRLSFLFLDTTRFTLRLRRHERPSVGVDRFVRGNLRAIECGAELASNESREPFVACEVAALAGARDSVRRALSRHRRASRHVRRGKSRSIAP